MSVFSCLAAVGGSIAVVGAALWWLFYSDSAPKPSEPDLKLETILQPVQALGGKPVDTLRSNAHKVPLSPASDRLDLVAIQAQHAPEVVIRYIDGQGVETVRGLSNLRYSNSNYFHAYCHLRKEDRTFAVYRIKDAYDTATGRTLSELVVRWGTKGRTRRYYL